MLNTQNINRDKKNQPNLLTLSDPYPELAEAWLVTGEDESDASRVSEKLTDVDCWARQLVNNL